VSLVEHIARLPEVHGSPAREARPAVNTQSWVAVRLSAALAKGCVGGEARWPP
jgi:hypothetical protein